MSQIRFTPKITIDGSTSNEPFVKFTQNENWTSSNFCLHVNNGYTNLNGIIINGALNTSDTFYTSNNNINMSFNVTGDNNIIFKTNNLERLRILNNGNINIGTTTNSGDYKLNINGSISSTSIYKNNIELNNIYLLISSNYWLLNNSTNTLYTDPNSNISTIGIGNTSPDGYLHIGSPNISGSDGNIVLSKNYSQQSASSTFKIGYDSDFNLQMGTLDISTNPKTWKSQFLMNSSAPDNSFIISSSGNIGINTSLTDTYKVNIDGSLNATSITTIMGSNINNLNYNNITINSPDLKNLNNWNYNIDAKFIHNRIIPGILQESTNIGIGTTLPRSISIGETSFIPRLDVNGIINGTGYYAGGINIRDIYLSIANASSIYLTKNEFNTANFWRKQAQATNSFTISLNTDNINNTIQLGINERDKDNIVYLDVFGKIRAKKFEGDGSALTNISHSTLINVPSFLTTEDAQLFYYNKNYIDGTYLNSTVINKTNTLYATVAQINAVNASIASVYTGIPKEVIAGIITDLSESKQIDIYHSNILNLPYNFNESNFGFKAPASTNINNIITVGGTVLANNFNSSGEIYENNITLSNIYITSNRYHQSIYYYDKILDRVRSQLTEEKIYPPQSGSIFNNQYSNIVSNSISGNGLYIMISSTNLLNTRTDNLKVAEDAPASNLFNYNNTTNPWIISANYLYNNVAPHFYPNAIADSDIITKTIITSNSIDYSFYGHSILLYYSEKFAITKLNIIAKNITGALLDNAPKRIYLIATNEDSVLQTTFYAFNQNTRHPWDTILNNYEIKLTDYISYDEDNALVKCSISIPTNITAYKYYKLIITEVQGSSILHIQQLIFYGIEEKKEWLHSGKNLYSLSNISIGTIDNLSPYILNVNGYIYSSSNIYANSNIGIGNTNPLGNLHIASPLTNSDGTLIISKKDNFNNRNFKFGYDSDFNFVFGDYGTSNNPDKIWVKQFYINSNASEHSLMINRYGNIGINTNNITSDEKLFLNGNLRITGPINQTDTSFINKFKSDIFASNNIFILSNLNVSNIFTSNINVSNYITVNGIIHASKNIGIGTSTNLNASLDIQSAANSIGIWNACSGLNNTQKISAFIGKNTTNKNGFYNYYYYDNNGYDTNYLSWTTSTTIINNDILCITANKNVGIGITNPSGLFQIGNGGKLKISPNDDGYALIGLNNTDNNNNTKINLQGGSKRIEYYAAEGGHIFYTNYSANDSLRINNSGNISIGTTSDIHKVNINGSLYSSNNIFANSNIGIGNTNPLGNLHIASPLTNSDGTLIISRKDNINNRNFKFGYDSDFNFVFGDYLTGNNPDKTWVKQFYINSNAPQHSLLINRSGNIGIGNSIPLGNLHIGNPNMISDGTLIISKQDNINNRNFKFGYDSDFNFVFGDFGTNNDATRTWNKQFYIHSNASNNSLTINSNGNIGIGTTSALDQKLYVNGNTTINDGVIKQFSTDGNPNIFTNAILINTTDNTNYRLNVNGHVNIQSNLNTSNLNTSNLNVINNSFFYNKIRVGNSPIDPAEDDRFKFFINNNTCINNDFLCRNGNFIHSNGIFYINSDSLNVKNNALFTGNIGISTTIANNILQIHDGGRLRIANDPYDYSVIGTDNGITASTNTRIIINGNIRSGGNAGNIEYYTTTGKHIFYKSGTSNIANELMRIDNNGNIGIGTTSTANYKLNVLDNINVSGTGNINCSSLVSSNNIYVGTDPTDKTKTLNVYGSIFGTSNITIASNIITSNINSSNINNKGSFSNIGNLFITGNISQSGTYAFGGTTFNIGTTSETNKSMTIGGSITATSNIIAYSNIETTTLKSLFSSNTSNLYTCNIIVSGSTILNSNIVQNNSFPITLSGNLTLNSSTSDDQITINNTSANNYARIKFTNNSPSDAYIGIGGTNIADNYKNNLFIQSKTSIILNSGNNLTSSTPSLLITSTGNIGISTATANNILQIHDGGRLRISIGNTDYTVIGTDNGITASTNTRIIINGNIRSGGNAGNIEYYTTTGKHIFYKSGTSNIANELMRIDNSGNIGIGTTSTTNFKLNVNGQLNISNLIRENGDYLSNIYVKLENLSNLSINNFNLKKKFGYTCTINQDLISPNQIIYNDIRYWKFDINLTSNTKSLVSTVAQNSVCFRSFNIKCFLADCGFETFNIGVPNILQYDIYMSSNPINQACLPSIISPKSGLNICAIGTPENYNLSNILPTYITLLRKDYIIDGSTTDQSTAIIKNSFNYLSLVSPHSNLAVSYIIEDYLS